MAGKVVGTHLVAVGVEPRQISIVSGVAGEGSEPVVYWLGAGGAQAGRS